jgi:hypothetical protein
MKPQRRADEQTLRRIIAGMPADVGQVVKRACQKHGLLPGGGTQGSLLDTVADPVTGAADAIKARKK